MMGRSTYALKVKIYCMTVFSAARKNPPLVCVGSLNIVQSLFMIDDWGKMSIDTYEKGDGIINACIKKGILFEGTPFFLKFHTRSSIHKIRIVGNQVSDQYDICDNAEDAENDLANNGDTCKFKIFVQVHKCFGNFSRIIGG